MGKFPRRFTIPDLFHDIKKKIYLRLYCPVPRQTLSRTESLSLLLFLSFFLYLLAHAIIRNKLIYSQ